MNILIVSDQFLRGGLEEQIVNHVNTLGKYHRFCFAFGKYEMREFFEGFAVYDVLRCGPAMSVQDVLDDVDRLCEIIKKESIDFIEVHPFYAFLPVMLAANKCGVSVVHIMHGAPSILFDERLNLVVTQRFFFTEFAPCVIMPNHLFDHVLQRQYGVRKLIFAPNTIDMNKYSRVRYNPKGSFALFSRLDEDKYIQVKKAVDYMGDLDLKIDIYGDGSCLPRMKKHVLDNGLEKRVVFMGWAEDVSKILHDNDYAGVIGGSRVALEGLASNLPTLLIGWDKVSGFIDAEVYGIIKNLNTSNRSLKEISESELKEQLNELQMNPSKFRLRELAKRDFDNSVLTDIFDDVFDTAFKNMQHSNLLDELLNQIDKMTKENKKEMFFASATVSNLLEKIFIKHFVANPLVMDLFRCRKIQKENDELRKRMHEYTEYMQEQLSEMRSRLDVLENKKGALERGIGRVVRKVKSIPKKKERKR